jgi:hypothetical protein
METIFEVRHQRDGAWLVCATIGDRIPVEITGFESQADAEAWIKTESAAWLSRWEVTAKAANSNFVMDESAGPSPP